MQRMLIEQSNLIKTKYDIIRSQFNIIHMHHSKHLGFC